MGGTRKRSSPTDKVAIILRIFVLLGSVSGIGLAVLALVMEFPPKSLPAWSMVSLGILTFLAALIGFVGSFSRNMCLIVYFVLGAISFLMQVAILVGLFFFYDQTLNAYTKGNPERLAYIEPYLDVGRWVFLGLVALQGVSLSMAVFMRCCCHLEEDFMDLESAQDKELHLQQLKEDISSMGEGSAAQDKVANRFKEKYGHLMH